MRSTLLLFLTALAGLAEPRVYISVNGAQKAQIWHGAPVILEAVVTGAEAGPSLEHWQIGVVDSENQPLELTFRMSGPEDNGRRVEWLLDPALTRELKGGSYRLHLTSDTYAPGATNQVVLNIVDKPEEPAEALVFRDLQWHAYYELRTGQAPAALNLIESWLHDHPGDVRALAYRADLLEKAGHNSQAILAYSRAIEAEEKLRKDEHSREPAGILYIKRDALLRRMMQK